MLAETEGKVLVTWCSLLVGDALRSGAVGACCNT